MEAVAAGGPAGDPTTTATDTELRPRTGGRRRFTTAYNLDFACPDNGATHLQTRRAHELASLQEQNPSHRDRLRASEAFSVYDRNGARRPAMQRSF